MCRNSPVKIRPVLPETSKATSSRKKPLSSNRGHLPAESLATNRKTVKLKQADVINYEIVEPLAGPSRLTGEPHPSRRR